MTDSDNNKDSVEIALFVGVTDGFDDTLLKLEMVDSKDCVCISLKVCTNTDSVIVYDGFIVNGAVILV